jgi:hypothetical protein
VLVKLPKAFLAGKAKKSGSASSDGENYFLHGNKIASRKGSNIEFDWVGWHTPTTANHMNTILHHMGANERVSYAQHRDNGTDKFLMTPDQEKTWRLAQMSGERSGEAGL